MDQPRLYLDSRGNARGDATSGDVFGKYWVMAEPLGSYPVESEPRPNREKNLAFRRRQGMLLASGFGWVHTLLIEQADLAEPLTATRCSSITIHTESVEGLEGSCGRIFKRALRRLANRRAEYRPRAADRDGTISSSLAAGLDTLETT